MHQLGNWNTIFAFMSSNNAKVELLRSAMIIVVEAGTFYTMFTYNPDQLCVSYTCTILFLSELLGVFSGCVWS